MVEQIQEAPRLSITIYREVIAVYAPENVDPEEPWRDTWKLLYVVRYEFLSVDGNTVTVITPSGRKIRFDNVDTYYTELSDTVECSCACEDRW